MNNLYPRERAAKLARAVDHHWPKIRLCLCIIAGLYALMIFVGEITHPGPKAPRPAEPEIVWLDGGRLALLRVPDYLRHADADSAFIDGRFNRWLAECRHSGFEWTGSLGTDRHDRIPFRRVRDSQEAFPE